MDKKRSYAKESYKSKPTGIRFNLDQEKVALMRSRKKTRQQLVDFLLETYVKGENPITERLQAIEKPLFNIPMVEPSKPIEIKRTPQEWVAAKREIVDGDVSAYNQWLKELEASGLASQIKTQIKFA